MKRFLSRLSFAGKLKTVVLVTAGVAMLIAIVLQSVSGLLLARRHMIDDIAALAQIVSANTTTAVTFGDVDEATRALLSLSADTSITSAGLYRPDGSLLTGYTADRGRGEPHTAPRDLTEWITSSMIGGETTHRLNGRTLDFLTPVRLNREIIGWLHVRSFRARFQEATSGSVLLGLAAIGAAGLIALLLANALNQIILQPITSLTRTTEHITQAGDFGLRAERTSNDEIGGLVDSFNTMLEQIAQRDSSLERYRSDLERQVVERTDSLATANEKLKVAIADATRAKDAALSASKAKSEFLARMSHEIRTPMNGVLGMTELLLGTELTRRQQQFAHTIRHSADALLMIINDVLDFSKIEAGKLVLEQTDFDLRDLIEETVDLLAPKAQEKDLALAAVLPPDFDPVVRGDPLRVRQILTNLLGNAIKFTEEGEIAVRVEETGSTSGQVRLRVEVTDTGIGIAPEHRHMVFDSFAQEDGSTTRRFGGTGLGLAICRQLVELMGGKIGVDSTPGEGSTFWFTLALERGTLFQRVQPTDTPDLEGKRVLLLDDHVTNLEILENHCQAWGVITERATTVAEARDLLDDESCPFDLAILDMNLPDGNGLELARTIRKQSGLDDLRLLILSSVSYDLDPLDREHLRISASLTKPLRQSALRDALARAFGDPVKTMITPLPTDFGRELTEDLQVLLVEDNPVNLQVGLGMLHSLGCAAYTALNGREALELLDRQAFDVVLMDCQMPEMDGLEATRRQRQRERDERGRSIPIIALTANAIAGDRQRCLDAGMNDYLSKPFTRKDLQELLWRWGGRVTDNHADTAVI